MVARGGAGSSAPISSPVLLSKRATYPQLASEAAGAGEGVVLAFLIPILISIYYRYFMLKIMLLRLVALLRTHSEVSDSY